MKNKVFEEIDNIRLHPIYKEAMRQRFSNLKSMGGKVFSTMFGLVLLVALLLIISDRIDGKRCMKECQTEGEIADCNDFCY